jgi:3-phosphoshikimate 1-carboxyvinyltransferase
MAAGLLSQAGCVIENFGKSDDVLAARDIISQLGAVVVIDNDKLVIRKSIVKREKSNKEYILNCRESALCARLFTPIACLFNNPFTVVGCGTLLKRTVADNYTILRQMGGEYESIDGKLPVYFKKAFLKSGEYKIDGSSSSQFISGLVFSLPLLEADSKLVISNPVSVNYILMTIEVIASFGVNINYRTDNHRDLIIDIPRNQTYKSKRIYTIEGDWSGIANICVAAAVNGKIGVKGLYENSLQPDRDILKVFDLAGVHYYWDNDILVVEKSEIKAFDYNAVNCPDLIPAITVLAAFANGESHIYGASRLKSKESSRAEVLQNELTKANLNIKVRDDLIQIIGKGKYRFAEFDPNDDHRIAMALTVFGLLSENGARLENRHCVSKSYPNFFEDLKKISVDSN